MKKVMSLIAMVGMATTALAQEMGQWRGDRLYSQGQATNICRAPLPGEPAFITFDCNDINRTPILRIDMRHVADSGWVYGYRYEGNVNFRYRFHGALFPSEAHWEFCVNGIWPGGVGQVPIHPQPPANVAPPIIDQSDDRPRRAIERQDKEEGAQTTEEAQKKEHQVQATEEAQKKESQVQATEEAQKKESQVQTTEEAQKKESQVEEEDPLATKLMRNAAEESKAAKETASPSP